MQTPFWKSLFRRKLAAATCSAIAALVVACGGGVLVAEGVGVGTGGTGIVNGAISGLGSIIVEGVRYDDSQATLVRLPDLLNSETLSLSDLQVGQYASLEFDASGTMVRANIQSQLVGPVGSISAANGRFAVWGQTVSINVNPDVGPVTVFSGYAGLAAVSPLDRVQVYGALQVDPTNSARDVIRATRVERLADATTLPARVTGTARTSANGTWTLSTIPLDTGSAVIAPENQKIADGDVVTAVIAWPQPASAVVTSLKASAVRIIGLGDATAGSARLSGIVTTRPDGQMLLQGVPLDVSAPSFAALRDTVRNGTYVTLVGTINRSTGALVVDAAEMVPAGGRPMELWGSVTSLLNQDSFSVRGMWINARAAQWVGGAAANLANGSYVEITGSVTGNVLNATKVVMQSTLPDKAVLDVSGLVLSVDTASRRMSVLTSDNKKLDLLMDAATVLPTVGATVRAAGFWKDGSLTVNTLSNQPAMDSEKTLLEGIVDSVAVGQFSVNGIVVYFDSMMFPSLQLKGGERIEVWVKVVGGQYQVVDAKTLPPRR